MQNNIVFQPKGPIQNSNPTANEGRVQSHSKAYTSSSPAHQKALGSSDSDLAAWMREAQAYYNAVMNGSVDRPAAAAWNEFLAQMDWANAQLGGTDSSGLDWGEDGEDSGVPSVNDFGGELGPNGNYNYDLVETNIGFTGDGTRNDVYGTDNTIDLDMPSAQVSCELTQDNGATVLKVVVTTSKGTAVYYYDNYDSPDFKLDIKIPDVSKVTGLNGLPAEVSGKIEVKKYTPRAENNGEIRESSVEGTPIDGEENAYYYEGTVGETIEFTPQGSGNDGEVTTHDVYGDSNISVKASDRVHTAAAEAGADYDYTVTVTHKDGSVDVFRIRKAFDTNINAVEEFITFDADGDGVVDFIEPGKVPDSLKDFLTLNRSETAEDGEALHEGDTVPDSTDGDVANYTTSTDVEIHADYDDSVDTHNIAAPGTVTIHGADYSDTMKVEYDEATQTWTISVFKGGDAESVEKFIVKGGPNTKVILDVMGEDNVTGDDAAKNTVQIGLEGTPGSSGVNGETQVIDQLGGLTGRSEEEILRGIFTVYPEFGRYDANHDGKLTRDEFAKVIEDGYFPPATPDQRFMHLLYDLDPELKSATDRFRGTQNTFAVNENEASDSDYARIRDRIVGLLSVIYPDANVSAGGTGESTVDDIVFNGVHYDVVNQADFYGDNWGLLHMDNLDD